MTRQRAWESETCTWSWASSSRPWAGGLTLTVPSLGSRAAWSSRGSGADPLGCGQSVCGGGAGRQAAWRGSPAEAGREGASAGMPLRSQGTGSSAPWRQEREARGAHNGPSPLGGLLASQLGVPGVPHEPCAPGQACLPGRQAVLSCEKVPGAGVAVVLRLPGGNVGERRRKAGKAAAMALMPVPCCLSISSAVLCGARTPRFVPPRTQYGSRRDRTKGLPPRRDRPGPPRHVFMDLQPHPSVPRGLSAHREGA